MSPDEQLKAEAREWASAPQRIGSTPAILIERLLKALTDAKTQLAREAGYNDDLATHLDEAIIERYKLMDERDKARTEVERRPAPDFFQEILRQRNAAETQLAEANRKLEAIRELTEPNDWVHPELILEALGLLEDPDLSYPTLDALVPVVLDTKEGE